MPSHTLQTLAVAVIVIACAAYAAWALMPMAARRGLASGLLRLSPPQALAAPLRRSLLRRGSCACDGCAAVPAATPTRQAAATKPIVFHPRRR